MQIPLKIVPDARGNHAADAWFIAGSGPLQWLTELERWEIGLESVELRLVSESKDHRLALGVIATAGTNSENSGKLSRRIPSSSGRQNAVPYRRIAGRLFLPADAAIAPGVIDDELLKLMPTGGDEFVWHPSAGLVRIESTQQLRVVDLLLNPSQRIIRWDHAIPGTSFRSRLISVEPDSQLTVEEILNQAVTEIGAKGQSLDQLPPTPDEWFGGKLNQLTKPLRDALRAFKERTKQNAAAAAEPKPYDQSRGGNSTAGGVTGPFAAMSSAAGLIAQGLGVALLPLLAVGAAAGKLAEKLSFPLIDQLTRNREIERLMHLLKTDPDSGLKFALPVGGSDSSRGIAPPSNQLLSREVGFSLSRLGSGGPSDMWDVSPDQQLQLIQQYRELAMREIRLGRYRRAAYIYAELLNDLNAAAGALESGQHFREAAALYRDRLNRPVDAAMCLERAGLLDEAALIFLDAGMFERAADLYVRLGRPEEAERLLRSYAEQLISNGDYRNASRIFHDKLSDVDSALSALGQAWPSSSMALACLEQSFVLMGQYSRHDSAAKRIVELRESHVDRASTRLLAKGFSTVFAEYPDRTVRETAADATQLMIARILPHANPSESKDLLTSLRRLAPQDKLLSRDCDRFVQNQQRAVRSKSSNVKKRSHGIEEVDSCWMQLSGPKWHVAKTAGKAIYMAGFEHGSLVLQRLEWGERGIQRSPAIWSGISSARRLILEPYPGDASDVILHPVGIDSIGKRGLPTSRDSTISAGTPTWATAASVALTREANGYGWCIREEFGSLSLHCFSPQGGPQTVWDLKTRSLSGSSDSALVSLCVLSGQVQISLGSHLCTPNLDPAEGHGSFENIERFDAEIQTLYGATIGKQNWLCALFENEGVLVDDEDPVDQIKIAAGIECPCASFLPSGLFVVAGMGQLEAYHFLQNRPHLIGSHSLDGKPIGVIATDKVGECAVVTEDGTIKIFSISADAK